jgi:hypothetical protein
MRREAEPSVHLAGKIQQNNVGHGTARTWVQFRRYGPFQYRVDKSRLLQARAHAAAASHIRAGNGRRQHYLHLIIITKVLPIIRPFQRLFIYFAGSNSVSPEWWEQKVLGNGSTAGGCPADALRTRGVTRTSNRSLSCSDFDFGKLAKRGTSPSPGILLKFSVTRLSRSGNGSLSIFQVHF